ncbi:MAG TPA: hypothetical protein VGX24_00095 [Pyrinomonadaceae bacterium]|jgi:hypothetical protein|nr:hypothetical protein [Pyrinomonadaceae bacterium]
MAANTKRMERAKHLTGRAARYGGLRMARRLIKPIPIVGTAVALGFAGYEIRRKGWRNGLIHVGLDVTPVVGTVKDVIELFTGDLLPDKDTRKG